MLAYRLSLKTSSLLIWQPLYLGSIGQFQIGKIILSTIVSRATFGMASPFTRMRKRGGLFIACRLAQLGSSSSSRKKLQYWSVRGPREKSECIISPLFAHNSGGYRLWILKNWNQFFLMLLKIKGKNRL